MDPPLHDDQHHGEGRLHCPDVCRAEVEVKGIGLRRRWVRKVKGPVTLLLRFKRISGSVIRDLEFQKLVNGSESVGIVGSDTNFRTSGGVSH